MRNSFKIKENALFSLHHLQASQPASQSDWHDTGPNPGHGQVWVVYDYVE